MDVYVVWKDDCKDEGILGVSMDEKTAKLFADKHTDSMCNPVIEKYTVISNHDIVSKTYYMVTGKRDKYLFDKPNCYIVGDNEKELEEEGFDLEDLCNVYEYRVGKEEYAVNILEVVVESDSAESAIDLAIELFQEYEKRNVEV